MSGEPDQNSVVPFPSDRRLERAVNDRDKLLLLRRVWTRAIAAIMICLAPCQATLAQTTDASQDGENASAASPSASDVPLAEMDVHDMLSACRSLPTEERLACRVSVCLRVTTAILGNGGQDHRPYCQEPDTKVVNMLASEVATAKRALETRRRLAESQRRQTCYMAAVSSGLQPGPDLDSFVGDCAAGR